MDVTVERKQVRLPWGRYSIRTDRPWWRQALVFPCWCITHDAEDCPCTWRRDFSEGWGL